MSEAADPRALRGPAETYDRHVGRYGAQLACALVEAAGVRPGERALDVGCGPGPLTRVLADRLGAENVAAIDPSEAFVAACRGRIPGADVRVAVAEELPFASNEFDVVLAQLVVQLMDDRDRGSARWCASRGRAVSSPPASGTRAPCHCSSRSGTRR